jgi:glutaredoxin/glutathione-dependent peroxiredoxin
MKAWSKASLADGKVLMLADGNGTFAKAIGLDFDLAVAGMGIRSRRYSMLVENGVVKTLNVEDKGGVNVSGSETILTQI